MLHRALLAVAIGLSIAAVGCSSATESDEESSALESELAVREIVKAGTKLRVTASSLNLRTGPSTDTSRKQLLHRGEIVTCVATGGDDGWVNVRSSAGVTGYAFGKYLVRQSEDGDGDGDGDGDVSVDPPSGGGSGEDCSPSRAQGAVNRYQKALHDAIAYAEGTRGHSKDGYDVMFSYKIASTCQRHPNQCQPFGDTCSTAAGRYQFLTKTWNGVASARGYQTFEPENQERGAAYLIANVRRVTIPSDRPLTATEFSNAMSKLSYEWASLPPGRYGQPNKSMQQMRSTYCAAAGC